VRRQMVVSAKGHKTSISFTKDFSDMQFRLMKEIRFNISIFMVIDSIRVLAKIAQGRSEQEFWRPPIN
jgi:hypothetical protein